jgi:hypothetical protein
MELKKYPFLLIFVCSICFVSRAQKNLDYLITKDTLHSGLKLVSGPEKRNAVYISERKANGEIVKHTADEVSEFGFRNGRKFKALTLDVAGQQKRFFFEEIVTGNYNIYFLNTSESGREFYINTGNSTTMVKIPEKRAEFIALLKQYESACPAYERNYSYLTLTKNALARFHKGNKSCEGVFPRARFEFRLGVSFVKYQSQSVIARDASFANHNTFSPGIFFHAPVEHSNFSFNTGASFTRLRNSTPFTSGGAHYDMSVDQWRANVPLNARYTFFDKKSRPYLEGGPLYSGYLSGSSKLYQYTESNNNVFIDATSKKVMSNNQVGFGLGAGFMIRYSDRLSYSVNAGLCKQLPVHKTDFSVNMNQVTISAGILF